MNRKVEKDKKKSMSTNKAQPISLVETPELDKMLEVSERSHEIGAFLDWLFNEKNLTICKWRESGTNGEEPYLIIEPSSVSEKDHVWDQGYSLRYVPSKGDLVERRVWAKPNPDYEAWAEGFYSADQNIERILAAYFQIDLDKVDAERGLLFQQVRSQAEQFASTLNGIEK